MKCCVQAVLCDFNFARTEIRIQYIVQLQLIKMQRIVFFVVADVLAKVDKADFEWLAHLSSLQ